MSEIPQTFPSKKPSTAPTTPKPTKPRMKNPKSKDVRDARKEAKAANRVAADGVKVDDDCEEVNKPMGVPTSFGAFKPTNITIRELSIGADGIPRAKAEYNCGHGGLFGCPDDCPNNTFDNSFERAHGITREDELRALKALSELEAKEKSSLSPAPVTVTLHQDAEVTDDYMQQQQRHGKVPLQDAPKMKVRELSQREKEDEKDKEVMEREEDLVRTFKPLSCKCKWEKNLEHDDMESVQCEPCKKEALMWQKIDIMWAKIERLEERK